MSRADANARHVELTVGELARRSGVPASTVRFYERQGLIHSRRTSGNQRRYDRDTLRRVAFVRASQRLGIRLADIGEALRLLPRARTPTQEDWARVSAGWHGELSLRIELLLKLRDKLTDCIGCGCLSPDDCALVSPCDVLGEAGAGASGPEVSRDGTTCDGTACEGPARRPARASSAACPADQAGRREPPGVRRPGSGAPAGDHAV